MDFRLLLMAACFGAVQAALTDMNYIQALRALRVLGNTEQRRGVIDCKALGDECNGVIPCCGTTQCYWQAGYDALEDGECVQCVSSGKKCQRDSQCCANLQCDKGNALWVDGTCQKYRRNEACYRDGQCVNDCKKSWYETNGICT